MQAKGTSELITAKWHQLVLVSAPRNTQNSYINPFPTSPASRVVIYSWLAAFPVEMEPFKDHSRTRGHLIGLRNKPQQNQPGQLSAQVVKYLPEMLVNVYSYRVMEKSVSCCCVRGGRVISNPVTICDSLSEKTSQFSLFQLYLFYSL